MIINKTNADSADSAGRESRNGAGYSPAAGRRQVQAGNEGNGEIQMKPYAEMTMEELEGLEKELRAEYKKIQARGLELNMSRGKPCTEQLDLSMGMMDVLSSEMDLLCEDGTDCRNGNSSLNVMYDQISRSYSHGVMGNTPWCKLDKVKFICIVPGYDRHFRITEYFGIENVCVPMLETGPDMDMIEKLVSEDESIKGIWCTPKYSNPTGNSYSDETVRRFARLEPAAKDFRIYWDNAYTIHHLYDHAQDHLIEILAECKSTSKVSFPGSGLAALASSLNNLEDIRRQLQDQTIGHDKVNQLRHVRLFGNIHGMVEHMRRHADILRPKFEAVEDILEEELGGLGIARWTKPKGGYFISFDTMDGCAKEVVRKCAKAGVIMTPAGATYPGGHDPHDSNIRIAPSFPPLEDLKTAARLLALATKLAAAQKLLKEKQQEAAGAGN